MSKFLGQRIIKDKKLETGQFTKRLQIPIVSQPNDLNTPEKYPGAPGSLVYNPVDNSINYSNGSSWSKLIPSSGGGGGGGLTDGFSFFKSGPQSIASSTKTTITQWDTSLSPAYLTINEWNLTTGIYTSSSPELILINVGVQWADGNSNVGSRILNIEHMQANSGIWDTIKSTTIQPNGNLSIPSAQYASLVINMNAGDSIRCTVTQNSGISVTIQTGAVTTISGFRIVQ